MTKENIALLEMADVHDSEFCRLTMDFEKGSIEVVLEGCDGDEESLVCFKGVWAFASDYPENTELAPQECYGIEIEEAENGKYTAYIVVNLNAQPVWLITIGFTDLELKGGLSQKNDAML